MFIVSRGPDGPLCRLLVNFSDPAECCDTAVHCGDGLSERALSDNW